MTVEQRARAAATDLHQAVAHQVSADAARARLRGRLRARHLERAVLAVGVAALAVGWIALAQPLGRTAAPPAAPTVDPSAAPASDCLFTTACAGGPYRAALSVPTTFDTAGVGVVRADTPGYLEVTDEGGGFGLTVLANPQAFGPAAPAGSGPRGLAESLVQRRDVTSSGVITTQLAGRPALVVDVYPRADPPAETSLCLGSVSCTPLFTVGSNPQRKGDLFGLAEVTVLRVYVLEVPGQGTVLVALSAPSSSPYGPAPALGALRPVLDSLRFGSP